MTTKKTSIPEVDIEIDQENEELTGRVLETVKLEK